MPSGRKEDMEVTFAIKGLLSNIKRARTLLERANFESCHDNRDTQMIEEAIKIISKVIEFNQDDQQTTKS